jgi:hypothetical protein
MPQPHPISEAWQLFSRHASNYILVTLLYLGISIAASLGTAFASPLASWVVSGAVAGPFTGGLSHMALAQLRGKSPDIDDGFKSWSRFVDFVVVGLVLSIVPLITYTLFLFAPVRVALGDDFKQALQRSLDAVTKNFGDVIVFVLVALVINILGMIPCGLGLLVTIPLTAIGVVKLAEHLGLVHDAPGAPDDPGGPGEDGRTIIDAPQSE